MKIFRIAVSVSLLSAGFLVVGFAASAHAQGATITDDQINRISTSCVGAKNTLNQLHTSDALLRVNRGQMYESMTTKLMSRFNSRAGGSRVSADDLNLSSQNYALSLASFRADYQQYEQQLSLAIGIDCNKEPVAFYDAVALARTKRATVHNDVVALTQNIDAYTKSFDAFRTAFKNTPGTN